MQFPVPVISDEVLLSLCDNSDYSRTYATRQAINDSLHAALNESPLAKLLGGRTVLKDRYPIVGKNDQGLFTKDLVGFQYHGGRRVTIPTFDIVTGPTLKAEVFRTRNITLLRQVFVESVEALCKCELMYFRSLLQQAGNYNSNYKLFDTKKITIDVLLEATQPMVDRRIMPKAVFMHEEGSERLKPLLDRLGIALMTSPEWDSDVHVFGQPIDENFTNAHLVDNGTIFAVTSKDNGVNMWHEPVTLKQSLNEGFLMGSLGAMLIERKDSKLRPRAVEERVQAFVVGEEGGDIVRMYV